MFDFLFKLTPGELVNTVADFFFTSTPTQAEQIVDATLPVVQYVNSTLVDTVSPFNPFGGVQDLICAIPTETAVAVIDNAPAVIDNASAVMSNATAVIDTAETLIGNASNAVAIIGQTSSPTILEMCSAAASNITDKALELTPQTVVYGLAAATGLAALKAGQVAYDKYRKPVAVTNVASDAKVDVDPAVREYVEAMFKSEAHEAILQMPSDILEAIVEDETAFSAFIEDADKEQLDALSHLKTLKDFNAFLAFNPEQKSSFLKALSEDNKKQASPRLK